MGTLEQEVKTILEEPDVSGMDWNMGQSILANWKAGLPMRICQLISEPVTSETDQELIKRLEEEIGAIILTSSAEVDKFLDDHAPSRGYTKPLPVSPSATLRINGETRENAITKLHNEY